MQPAPDPLRANAANPAAAGYGFTAPTYTQVPNDLWAIMPDLSDPQLRVLLVIIRATLGYHQTTSGQLSITDIAKTAGLSRPAVIKAAHSLARAGLILQARSYPCSQWRVNLTAGTHVTLKLGEHTQPDQPPQLWPEPS